MRSDPEARYPTALPACVAMDSFPAAGCSPAVGGTRDFARVELVFVAHMGKTTLREKFPAPGSRRMPDLPGATPHLALGWATFSPIAVAEGLQAARQAAGKPPAEPPAPRPDLQEVEALYKLDLARLWKGSVFPAAEADGAWVSGAAAYRQLLRAFGDDPAKSRAALSQSLADLSLAHFSDDWSAAAVVYGTSRQVEAGHTLALRWQAALADGISETLPPVVKDAELDDGERARRDLLVLGGPADNGIAALAVERLREAGLDVAFGPGRFRFRGRTHARPDDGLLLSAENPWKPARSLTLVAANSAVQLHRMTRAYAPALPSWVLYRGDEPREQGFHPPERLTLELPRE